MKSRVRTMFLLMRLKNLKIIIKHIKILKILPIYIIEQNKVFPRREINAYGYEKLYKVQAVTIIPPLKKSSSEDQNNRSRQKPSKSLTRRFFTEVLEEACEREQDRTINIHTTGYTRNAMPFYNIIQMREYC